MIGRSAAAGGFGGSTGCSTGLSGESAASSKSTSITSTPFSSLLTLEGWSSETVMRFTPSIFLVLVKKEAQVRVSDWNEAVSGFGSSGMGVSAEGLAVGSVVGGVS